MKKINVFVADAVVGGNIPKTCYVKYFRDATNACMSVTRCEDKFGKEVSNTTVGTDDTNCPEVDN